MKWAGMYLLGYIILVIGVMAALWKLKVLATIGFTWTLIGVVILIGFGIMIAVSHSGKKENIEIDRNWPGGTPDPRFCTSPVWSGGALVKRRNNEQNFTGDRGRLGSKKAGLWMLFNRRDLRFVVVGAGAFRYFQINWGWRRGRFFTVFAVMVFRVSCLPGIVLLFSLIAVREEWFPGAAPGFCIAAGPIPGFFRKNINLSAFRGPAATLA
jgi:hypothetical protein